MTNAAIDESLCDSFLNEKPNKQFSSEKQKDKAVVFHFVASVQEHDNFKTLSTYVCPQTIFSRCCQPTCSRTLPPTKKTRREAPSVFPLLAGGWAAIGRLDVAAFIYKFTCQNFDQARGVGVKGRGTRLSSYRKEKKLQPIFLLKQLRCLPLKPLLLRQKGTQRTCLRLPSLT